jgi:hypothetical protein
MEFKKIQVPIAQQFQHMTRYRLFRTNAAKHDMWDLYLKSFPEGSNPIFQEKPVHDCACCRRFIRDVGGLVAIIDHKIVTLWDVTVDEPAYQAVCDALANYVRSYCTIDNAFMTVRDSAGSERNFDTILGERRTFDHFFVNIPREYQTDGDRLGKQLNESRQDYNVFLRSLSELKVENTALCLDLIAEERLYRGDASTEQILTALQKEQIKFNAIPATDITARQIFVWSRIAELPKSVTRMLNTSLGTLLSDLSSGDSIEVAVKKYEAKVAPSNYKRPKGLVTKSMIENAKRTLTELGYISALERRFARPNDLTINEILFADRKARKVIAGDVFDTLQTKGVDPRSYDKAQTVTIHTFIEDILPRVETVEVLLENRHVGNLVSLVTAANPTAKLIFQWNNPFSWSYNGDVADSMIRDRVKTAGGQVEADVCCRLAWDNIDDLDLHMREPGWRPGSASSIYFRNKASLKTGGQLDVDMNAHTTVTNPVENIFYKNKDRMVEGDYTLVVHQFNQRTTQDGGFQVEFDVMGEVTTFVYPKIVNPREEVEVLKFNYSRRDGIRIIKSLEATTASKEVWGRKTQDFHRVNVLTTSPNHWGDQQIGHKHFFFMLDGCRNDGTARGFYNEFLRSELNEHRKVMEMVGAKMRTEDIPDQLSGLGFSATKPNTLKVRVAGSYTRMLNITFA